MKLFRRRFTKAGLPPGTLMAPQEPDVKKPVITLFQFDKDTITEKSITSEELKELQDTSSVIWINIDGLDDVDIFHTIGELFSIHDLSLEDILNIDQRPKLEEHEGYILAIVKMIYLDSASNQIEVEQVSMILHDNIVFTFQEKPGDVFTPIRERLRNNKGRIRSRGADYLLYALLDAIVDNYYGIFELLGEQITDCENDVINSPSLSTSTKIHSIRNKLILLRRSIWPLRDVVTELRRNESDMFRKDTEPFLRDLYDHTVHNIEAMETYRDMLSGLLDGYNNAVSNRMNEIMKILTIISTLFIPLSFMAGLYGMNFKYMPELEWQWGYPVLLLVMAGVIAGLLLYFRRKKWI